MVTSIEILSKLKRRITLTLPLTDLETEINQRLRVRARTAKARGFRPGKVPMKMVIAQFGYQVKVEVLNDKIFRAFKDTTADNNLYVVGHPKIEQKISKNSLTFDATFEVYPEIMIGDFSLIEVEKIIFTVTDIEINKTIELLRKQRLHYYIKDRQKDTYDSSVDQLAQFGDRITIDFFYKIDGVEYQDSKTDNFVFILGEGQVPLEFEHAILNLKTGECKNFLLTFPFDYYNKDVAGKTAEFCIYLKKLECAHPLEINAEFAKSLGIPDGDLNKMRIDIKHNLELEIHARIKAKIKDNVMNALIKISNLDIPQILIEQDAERLTEIARQDIVQRDIDVKNIKLSKDSFMMQAERRVRLGLILAEIAKTHRLTVSKEQVTVKIKEFAKNYTNPEQVLKYYFSDPCHFAEIEALVLEDNVINYVLTKCKVSEKMLTFEALMDHESQIQLLFPQQS